MEKQQEQGQSHVGTRTYTHRLLGVERQKNIAHWDLSLAKQNLKLQFELANHGGDIAKSPLHLALETEDDRVFDAPSIELAPGLLAECDFLVGRHVAVLTPQVASAANIALILGSVYLEAQRRLGLTVADDARIVHITAAKSGRFAECTELEPMPAEQTRQILEGFITAACTNNELDFDVEMELSALRLRSSANRERIRTRMQKMGVSSLKGRKADVFLRRNRGFLRVNYALLKEKFPEAYAECVSQGESQFYLSVKLHKEGADGKQ